ncbi:rRNA maturation RNase YbeY [Aeromicrobium duanguangcaii]|uniref:Endoribonuclease YbeY n=1 Tax=Aeromicrobium duanguangcaii TaxID=2968086 RepID=A0ABY5KG47_9ACTN|nr:rRNA maturation RNase YbeY [Aeromicrobium duanguangcaii]MCD9153460.1 rRNA maturation RNase YbeY [Aeromicrobium duanguangcaii]MCL3836553.1 rRNA maturation RNase YbeY [Aeromicrobium duanguangcaii]UUI69451.1 rRNA maturation RNase YbeY [Aeromicrobium duanguangcaii]
MTVDVLNESGVEVDVAGLTSLCRFVMRRMRLHPQTEMTLRLVDTDTIAVLNEQWMGKKGPTDVLSFPMDELTPGDDDEDRGEAGYLGDIALCPQIAEQQAPAAGHERDDEMALLTVHGMLHLLGYDHAEPEEHAEMFGIQGRLLLEWADPALREP